MAYMSQEKKRTIVAKAKPVLKKYGVSATFRVRNHSTLEMNVREGQIDFINNFVQIAKPYNSRDNYVQVNPYHYREYFSGQALDFLKEIMPILNDGNWDESDIQTDYFNVGWYVNVNIGNWDKGYVYTG